ncbi:MAG: DUF2190 family protein [Xanthomonadaceae bacterium]|nr:DUF2190 family protein [Xanthomonadaceae bacterium]
MAVTPTDFAGVLTILAPSATTANNAAGQIVQDAVSSLRYISLGPTLLGGTTAQNQPIAVEPLFPYSPKAMVGVAKSTGQAWKAGQLLYIDSSNNWRTNSTGNTKAGFALVDAASSDQTGNVVPASPL